MKRILSFLMILVMVFMTVACTNKNSNINSTDSETFVSISEDIPEKESADLVTEKPVISDFYGYALSQWLADSQIEEDSLCVSFEDTYTDEVFAKLKALIVGKDASDYPNNASMQKLLLFFNQMNDEASGQKAAERIAELVNEVENVHSIEDYYNLVTKTEFCGADILFYRDYLYTDSCDYLVVFMQKYYQSTYDLSDTDASFLKEEIARQFVLVGFTNEEASAKADNALELNKKINDSYSFMTGNYSYWNEADYEASGHVVPFFDFLRKMGYCRYDVLGNEIYDFFADEGSLSFYDTVLTEDNLPLLKDYLEMNLMRYYFCFGNKAMKESDMRISMGLGGYSYEDESNLVFKDSEELLDYNIDLLSRVDYNTLSNLYKEVYISDEIVSEIEDMTKLYKDEFVKIIKESDVFSDRVKENLGFKIKKLKVFLGEEDIPIDYSDIELGDNTIDSLIAFSEYNRNVNKRFLLTKEGLSRFSIDAFSTNGQYSSDSNAIMLSWGTVQILIDNIDASTETKLGLFGRTLAHEIAHSICVPYYVTCGTDGLYMDYMTGEEYNNIWNLYYEVCKIANGVQTENGNKYIGDQCGSELFTDLVAVNCSLRILDAMNQADYDAYFTNLAKGYGTKMLPDYEKRLIGRDAHLFGRERVNLMLYQFDRFYETYDVDESSEWYVPADKRVYGY